MRHHHALVLVMLGAMSGLSLYVVVATQFAYGPVLVGFGGTHGIHLSDLLVIGLWSLSALAAWALWEPPVR